MEDLLFSDTTYKIRGAAFEVYNHLGYGHKETIYQKSLAKEFDKRGIRYQKEASLDVVYKEIKVGQYIPDFLVENKVVVELKSLEFLPQSCISQLTNYLKGTNYHVGLLINFGGPKLQIIRSVWTKGSA